MKTLYLFLVLLTQALPLLAQSLSTTSNKNRVIVRVPRSETDNLDGNYPVGQTSVLYSDGSGRTLQTVGFGLSPQQRDVIQAQTYDNLSRPNRTYLPSRVDAQTGAFRDNPEADAQNQYGDQVPYSYPEYDVNSRVRKQYGPGENWRNANKYVGQDLQTAGDNIRYWRFVEDGGHGRINGNSFYSGNVLTVQTTTNENGNQIITYTDKEEKLVRKDVQIEGGWLRTAYVYDDLNRLRGIITPKAYESSYDFSIDEKAELVFGFYYDNKGRLVEKLTPGGGWTHIVYNQLDQSIMTQDARQRPDNQWSFVKYDGLGRTVLKGVLADAGSRQAWQSQADNWGNEQFETRGGGLQYYTNNSLPQVGDNAVLVASYYDDHGWGVAGEGASAQGLHTGERARRLDTGDWLTTIIYYDGQSRPYKRLTDTHLGTNQTDYEYTFSGDITKETVIYRRNGRGDLAVITRYDFDHAGRRIRSYHKVGDESEIVLADYEYDEVGRMSQKRLQPGTYNAGGGTGTDYITRSSPPPPNTTDVANILIRLVPGFSVSGEYRARTGTGSGSSGTTNAFQTIDYRYNVRSNLRSINGDGNNNPALNASQNDLFALKLDFQEEGRYYNGNLSRQTWLSKTVPSPRTYQYSYDAADRLSSAVYGGGNGENYSLNGVSYDPNGNITGLSRNGMTASSNNQRSGQPTGFGLVDQLHYAYQNEGNRLDRVWDDVGGGINQPIDFRDNNSGGGNSDYGYYNDGSLSRDGNKNITSIRYNKLGLTDLIQFTDGRSISYVYDGAGAKLYKKVSQPAGTVFVHYIGDILYKGDNLFCITTDEGRVLPTSNGSYTYEYQYRDHLGNLRVAFRQAGASLQSMSTNEPVAAAREQAEFIGVAEHRRVGIAYQGTYSARVLDGTGPGKNLSVLAGETVTMRVMAYVPEQPRAKKRRWWPIPIVGPVSEEIPVDNGPIVSRSRWKLLGGIALPFGYKKAKPAELPKAYLQYVLTDTAGRVLATQRAMITDSARAGWQELQMQVRSNQAATLKVVVVNDALNTPVHFDNLTITQEPPVIAQETHYDPWGLELVGITTEGQPDDDFKFQGKEHQDDFALEWDDFKARMYDPQVGRWHIQDPADQFTSGYVGMGNSPAVTVDPDGKFAWFIPIIIGAVSGYLNGKAQGARGWELVGNVFAGAVIGGISGGFGQGVAAATAAWGTVGSGAISGAVSGAISGGFSTAFAGGDFGSGSLKGALWGGISGAAAGAAETLMYDGKVVSHDAKLPSGGPSTKPVKDIKSFINEKFSPNTEDIFNTRINIASNNNLPEGYELDAAGFITKGGMGMKGGLTKGHVPFFGKPGSTMYIAPVVGRYGADFTYGVVGHELIHAFHFQKISQAVLNTKYSEVSAYSWQIRFLKQAGFSDAYLAPFRSGYVNFGGRYTSPYRWQLVPIIRK